MNKEILDTLDDLSKRPTTELAMQLMETTADNMAKDKELERYKNIIDELEKWLLEQLYVEAENPYEEKIIKIENPEIASILNKLKELKGE